MRSHNVSASFGLNSLTPVTSCGYILIKRFFVQHARWFLWVSSDNLFICLNNVALLPWWMSLYCRDCCFLLQCPDFTVCRHLCVCLLCAHVRGQKGDGYRHVFPVILRCVCACTRACGRSCVFGFSPYLCGPDWSCRWTCRDLLHAALGYFWTAALLWDRLLEELPFPKPNDSCLDLGGWNVYLAPGWKLFIPDV